MKKNLLSIYNCLIPLIITIVSLSSIFMYNWWQGILLFTNSVIFGYIFYLNSQLSETYKWNNDDLKLMNIKVIKLLIKDSKINKKFYEIESEIVKENKIQNMLKK